MGTRGRRASGLPSGRSRHPQNGGGTALRAPSGMAGAGDLLSPPGITIFLPLRCHTQVVRERSAKPLFPGSNPGGTSFRRISRRTLARLTLGVPPLGRRRDRRPSIASTICGRNPASRGIPWCVFLGVMGTSGVAPVICGENPVSRGNSSYVLACTAEGLPGIPSRAPQCCRGIGRRTLPGFRGLFLRHALAGPPYAGA